MINGPGGPEGEGGAANPFGPGNPENRIPPELESRYAASINNPYTVEASDLIFKLKSAEYEITPEGRIDGLRPAVFDAMAYTEGLQFGAESAAYNLDGDLKRETNLRSRVLALQELFTSVEGSITRPNNPHVNSALNDLLERPVRESDVIIRRQFETEDQHRERASKWRNGLVQQHTAQQRARYEAQLQQINFNRAMEGLPPVPEERFNEAIQNNVRAEFAKDVAKIQKYAVARDGLIKLDLLKKASGLIDEAFKQRQRTTEIEEDAANVAKKFGFAFTPDKPIWSAEFQDDKEFGKKVNDVMRLMVGAALPESVTPEERNKGKIARPDSMREKLRDVKSNCYATGFTTEEFRNWLQAMMKESKGDMFAVWKAWQITQFWELVTQFGAAEAKPIDRQNARKGVKYGFSNPPLGSALYTWLMHFEQKQRQEYGISSTGERFQKGERFVKKSGHPLTIGKIQSTKTKSGALMESYLHNTSVKINGNDQSLFELWWGQNGNGTDFHSDAFPWVATEEYTRDATAKTEEAEMGSVSLWKLNTARAASVMADIQTLPKTGELADPNFFLDRVRTWSKVGVGPANIDNTPAEKNPRMWWVAGIIEFHLGGTNKTKAGQMSDELSYRVLNTGNSIDESKATGRNIKDLTVGDILQAAEACGFLRKMDIDYIKSKFNS